MTGWIALELIGIKVYPDTFTTFLVFSYKHLMRVVNQFLNHWSLTDFSHDALSVDSIGLSRDPLVEEENIVEIRTPPMRQRLVSVAIT